MAGSNKNMRKGRNKTFASKRTMNPPRTGSRGRATTGKGGFQEKDIKGRLGGFEGAGEHARTGNRGHQ